MKCVLAFRALGPASVRVGCVHDDQGRWRAFVASSERQADGSWRTDQADFDVGRPTREQAMAFAQDVLLPSFRQQGMPDVWTFPVQAGHGPALARELVGQGGDHVAAVLLLGQAPHEAPDAGRLRALAAHDPAAAAAQAAARVAKRKAAAQARGLEQPEGSRRKRT